jgi:hypothetical protein
MTITTYNNDIFIILYLYILCRVTINMRCINNTQKQYINTQRFNVVHPNLGYVQNDWLLILFISNLLTVSHCDFNNIYQLTLAKLASTFLLQCEPNSLKLQSSLKTPKHLAIFHSCILHLFLPKNPLQFISLQ